MPCATTTMARGLLTAHVCTASLRPLRLVKKEVLAPLRGYKSSGPAFLGIDCADGAFIALVGRGRPARTTGRVPRLSAQIAKKSLPNLRKSDDNKTWSLAFQVLPPQAARSEAGGSKCRGS
mmetsp:Transcript_7997/g.29921  ORF Transcript_7997/g.29921 Transcript_7997/m.29921 type:complete len:121 (-) Transcript_7997:404-766(-)